MIDTAGLFISHQIALDMVVDVLPRKRMFLPDAPQWLANAAYSAAMTSAAQFALQRVARMRERGEL